MRDTVMKSYTSFALLLSIFVLFTSSAFAVKMRLPLEGDDCKNYGCVVAGYFNHQKYSQQDYMCKSYTYYTATYSHAGIDYAIVPQNGKTSWQEMSAGREVIAVASGKVVAAVDGYYDKCDVGKCMGSGYGGSTAFGNYVRILHSDGTYSYYAHMKQGSVLVQEGDTVTCGQVIGLVGSSGNSQGPHLHFELRTSEDDGNTNAGRPKAYDPYAGPCSSTQETLWTAQGEYMGLPAPQCEGEPNPTPFSAKKSAQSQTILNRATFISETIPDDTEFAPNTPFIKKFVFRNDGNYPWSREEGFYIAYEKGDIFSEITRVDIPDGVTVKPGEKVTFEIPMVSPSKGGDYISHWIWKYQGISFQTDFWTKIIVTSPKYGAQLLSQDQSATTVAPGDKITKSWTFKNSGNTTWKKEDDYHFERSTSKIFEAVDSVELYPSEQILPGDTKKWTIEFTVPTALKSGIYTETWQNAYFEELFGTKVIISLTVKTPAYKNTFVKETIDDGTIFEAGQTFTKTWTFKNIGDTAWSSKQALYFVSGEKMGASETGIPVTGSVSSGKEYTFSVSFTAPQTKGTYRGYWQMKDQFGNWFGTKVWVEIRVKAVAPPVNYQFTIGTDALGWDYATQGCPSTLFFDSNYFSQDLVDLLQSIESECLVQSGANCSIIKNKYASIQTKTTDEAQEESVALMVQATLALMNMLEDALNHGCFNINPNTYRGDEIIEFLYRVDQLFTPNGNQAKFYGEKISKVMAAVAFSETSGYPFFELNGNMYLDVSSANAIGYYQIMPFWCYSNSHNPGTFQQPVWEVATQYDWPKGSSNYGWNDYRVDPLATCDLSDSPYKSLHPYNENNHLYHHPYMNMLGGLAIYLRTLSGSTVRASIDPLYGAYNNYCGRGLSAIPFRWPRLQQGFNLTVEEVFSCHNPLSGVCD